MAACASSIDDEVNLAKCVNLLLQKGGKVNASERHKVTALMFACKERRLQIVRTILLHDGVNLNLQDNRGWTVKQFQIFHESMLPTITFRTGSNVGC